MDAVKVTQAPSSDCSLVLSVHITGQMSPDSNNKKKTLVCVYGLDEKACSSLPQYMQVTSTVLGIVPADGVTQHNILH